MENCATNNENKLLQCAFEKFRSLRYPYAVEIRVYRPVHINLLLCHDYPQVWYSLNGTYMHQIEGEIYECAKGSLIVIPSGVAHKIWVPEDNEARILRFDVMYDIFQEVQPESYTNSIANLFLYAFAQEFGVDIPLYHMLSPDSQALIEEHLSWLAATNIRVPVRIDAADFRERTEEIFSLPELSIPEKYRKKVVQLAQARLRPIIQVLLYMNLHSSDTVTEESLLQVSAISRAALYRDFKQYTGYSCFVYLKWLRIRRAFLYLSHTTYSISYISDICGFSDLPHMSRTFSRFMGAAPKMIRIEQRKWLEDYPQDKLYAKQF